MDRERRRDIMGGVAGFVLLALLASVMAWDLSNPGADSAAAASATHEASLLGVIAASGGAFTIEDADNVKVRLTGVNAEALWFTDRPDRDAGRMATATLLGLFFGDNPDGPPNVALEVEDAPDHQDTVILELANPDYDADAGVFEADGRLLGDGHPRLATTSSKADAALPATFESATMFVDSLLSPYEFCGVLVVNLTDQGLGLAEPSLPHGGWYQTLGSSVETAHMAFAYGHSGPYRDCGATGIVTDPTGGVDNVVVQLIKTVEALLDGMFPDHSADSGARSPTAESLQQQLEMFAELGGPAVLTTYSTVTPVVGNNSADCDGYSGFECSAWLFDLHLGIDALADEFEKRHPNAPRIQALTIKKDMTQLETLLKAVPNIASLGIFVITKA